MCGIYLWTLAARVAVALAVGRLDGVERRAGARTLGHTRAVHHASCTLLRCKHRRDTAQRTSVNVHVL